MLLRKRQGENGSQCLFCGRYIRSARPKQWSVVLPLSFPGELESASQIPAAIALNCVFEPLYFIFIYFVHPLARCTLKVISSLTPFWLTKGFIGPLYFRIARETCILNMFLYQLLKKFHCKSRKHIKTIIFFSLSHWRKRGLMSIW